jgi:thioredoxin 1
MVVELTDNSVKDFISSNNKVLVQFSAPWCGPCRILTPMIEEIASENTGFSIGKVNVDNDSGFATEKLVRGIPTLIIFKDGVEVDRVVGVKTKNELEVILNN